MDAELVNIPVGYDLFRAEVMRAACADAAIKVQLVRNEHPETGSLVALQPSYLLAQAEDSERVEAIVERTYRLGDGSGDH